MKWGHSPKTGNGAGAHWSSGTASREWMVEVAVQWQRAIRCPDCRTLKGIRQPRRGAHDSAAVA